jgi:hypothetical protein
MESYNAIINSGASMEANSFKSGIDTNKCALSYSPSSFSGGKKKPPPKKKTATPKKPVKPVKSKKPASKKK